LCEPFKLNIRFLLSGYLSTLAGSSISGWADGTGTNVKFSSPLGVAVDTLGYVYVSDYIGLTIRVINNANEVSTLAGSYLNSGLVDGSGTNARFQALQGIAVSSDRNVYIGDYSSNAVRKMTTSGVVSTLFQQSSFNPVGFALSSWGAFFLSEQYPDYISGIATRGSETTTIFAGQGTSGHADGVGTQASFYHPYGIVFNSAWLLFVSDRLNHCIRTVDTNGTMQLQHRSRFDVDRLLMAGKVSTFAGTGGSSGYIDGALSVAKFWRPGGIAFDSSGLLFIADSGNNAIRLVMTAGEHIYG
jgi:hypothetical protein